MDDGARGQRPNRLTIVFKNRIAVNDSLLLRGRYSFIIPINMPLQIGYSETNVCQTMLFNGDSAARHCWQVFMPARNALSRVLTQASKSILFASSSLRTSGASQAAELVRMHCGRPNVPAAVSMLTGVIFDGPEMSNKSIRCRLTSRPSRYVSKSSSSYRIVKEGGKVCRGRCLDAYVMS